MEKTEKMSAEMSPAVGCITEITHFTP